MGAPTGKAAAGTPTAAAAAAATTAIPAATAVAIASATATTAVTVVGHPFVIVIGIAGASPAVDRRLAGVPCRCHGRPNPTSPGRGLKGGTEAVCCRRCPPLPLTPPPPPRTSWSHPRLLLTTSHSHGRRRRQCCRACRMRPATSGGGRNPQGIGLAGPHRRPLRPRAATVPLSSYCKVHRYGLYSPHGVAGATLLHAHPATAVTRRRRPAAAASAVATADQSMPASLEASHRDRSKL